MHGEERGSVDRGTMCLGAGWWIQIQNAKRMSVDLMLYGSYSLDPESRSTVLEAIPEVCLHYGWRFWRPMSEQTMGTLFLKPK